MKQKKFCCYNLFMIISFVLVSFAISIWSIYLISFLNGYTLNQDFLTVLIGVATFSIFTSFANSVWCAMKLNDKDKTKSVIGLVFSSLAFLLFISYFIMRYIVRIHELGMMLF